MRVSGAHLAPDRFGDRDDLLLVGLILLHLGAIWVLPYFPTQDGPSHLDNATILQRYFDPEFSHLYRYYTLNLGRFTNWLSTLILSGLVYLFPLVTAEKVYLSGYTILLPLSIRYAAGALSVRITEAKVHRLRWVHWSPLSR